MEEIESGYSQWCRVEGWQTTDTNWKRFRLDIRRNFTLWLLSPLQTCWKVSNPIWIKAWGAWSDPRPDLALGRGSECRPPWHAFQAQISCASTSDKNYTSVRNMQEAPSLMRKGSGQLGVVRAGTSEEAEMLYGKSWVSSQKLGNPVSVVFQQQKMDDKSAWDLVSLITLYS